jgi:hypothetical protein
VKPNILDNYPFDSMFANVGRILLSLNIIISVPYGCLMPRLSLYSILTLMIGKIRYKKTFHVTVTLMVLGGGLVIAEFVTNLGVVFEILGATAAVGLGKVLAVTAIKF